MPGQIQRCQAILDGCYRGSDPYPEDEVKSVYFDTFNLHSYFECLNGDDCKRKMRIRSYPGRFQAQIKRKRLNSVSKLKVDVKDTVWPTSGGSKGMHALLAETLPLGPLSPTCTIRYQRQRYRVFDYRVCLDHAIVVTAESALPAMRREVRIPVGVLEIKTRAEHPMLPLLGAMRLPAVAFSKYHVGLNLLRGVPDTLAKYGVA